MALVPLLGCQIQGKDGTLDVESLCENDVVGLYFSAHWCPPCRAFTPVLAESYKKLRGDGKKFEVVFISSDRDLESFASYYSEMPWLCLPYEDRDRKQQLAEKYGVRGIPTLVLINPKTGETLSLEGRKIITDDPNGDDFPWI